MSCSPLARLSGHGIHTVDNEIEQHLLEVDAVAIDFRQTESEFGVEGDSAQRGIPADQLQHVFHQRVYINGHALQLSLAQQIAHPPDHFARALVVPANGGQNWAQLMKRRRLLFQKQFRRLRVGENGPERLV